MEGNKTFSVLGRWASMEDLSESVGEEEWMGNISMFKQIDNTWQEPDDTSANNTQTKRWKTLSGYV